MLASVTRTVDKLEKDRPRRSRKDYCIRDAFSQDQVTCHPRSGDDEKSGRGCAARRFDGRGPDGTAFRHGASCAICRSGAAVADLSIIRGLDYYTGTVYETVFLDDPGYGSICSGGRYDDLAGSYINKHLPGVGISIGFSRLFARLLGKGVLPVGPKSPADMLMVLFDENQRGAVAAQAQKLRAQGWRVEQYHSPRKLPDQLKYAERKGIPLVYLPGQG